MKRRYYVRIELELHAISCPGVCLCPNGYIEVTLKSLGYFFKTGPMEPKFPVLYHDQFVMEGYFKSIHCYTQLERILSEETVEISLWQNGRRLAYFTGNLGQILHTPLTKPSCYHNVNVQLLMIPCQSFPGIISPRVEISARALVRNKFTTNRSTPSSVEAFVPCFPRPIVVSSHYSNHEKGAGYRRMQPVCHSRKDYKWHRSRSPSPPVRDNKMATANLRKGVLCGRCSENQSKCSSSTPQYNGKSPLIFNRNGKVVSCSSSSSSFESSNDSNKSVECGKPITISRTSIESEYDCPMHTKDCKICQAYDEIFNQLKKVI